MGRATGEDAAGRAPRPWGLPWPVALLLALAPSVAGALYDLRASHGLEIPFAAAYVLGCATATCLVRRRGLFVVMVTPPLVMLAAVTLAVWVRDRAQGFSSLVLAVATPVVPRFPVMAGTTVAVLLIGTLRLLVARGRGRAEDTPRVGAQPQST